MYNNEAFKRVLKYIEDNKLSEEQLKAASDNQILSVTYPVKVDNYLNINMIKNGLKNYFKMKNQLSKREIIKTQLENFLGKQVIIENIEDNTYKIEVVQ